MTLPPEPKPPTWAPAWSKPTGKLAPWPPAHYRREYPVKRGESWVSVAMGFLVPDVWDLIYFNFRTENPREVNWYMWRYLGCREAASDGLNFSFADASPGVLYIPPLGWKRTDHLPSLQTRVAEEIDRCGPHFPEVWYNNIHISRLDMHGVAQAIRTGLIDVVRDPTMERKIKGRWYPGSNKFTFRKPVFGNSNARANLVHEVTHAIIDMKKVQGIQLWENEFVAYATQALFAYNVNARSVNNYLRRVNAIPARRRKGRDRIYRAAYILGHYARKTRTSVLQERNREEDSFLEPGKPINPFLELQFAIRHAPPYDDRWWLVYDYDGV